MTEEGTTTGTDGGTETAYSSYPAQECIAALAAPRPIYCRPTDSPRRNVSVFPSQGPKNRCGSEARARDALCAASHESEDV